MGAGQGDRTLRRAEARAYGSATCGAEHPTRRLPDGSKAKITCDRPPEHKVQHRAKTRAGYVWWS